MGTDGPAWTLTPPGLRGHDDPRGRHRGLHPGVPRMSTLWAGDWVETELPEPVPAPRVAEPPAAPVARRRPARARPWIGRCARRRWPGSAWASRSRWRSAPRAPGSLAAPGGVATALGRLAGLVAAYAMVVVVLLVARFPPLERAIGQDRLVVWHRTPRARGRCTSCSRTRSLITVGYARAADDGVLHQFGQLLWTYPGVLAATAGASLLFAAGRELLPARTPPAWPTRPGGRCTSTPTWRCSCRSPTRSTRGPRSSGTRSRAFWWTALWVGTLALVVALPRSACRSGARCATGCAWSPSRRRGRAPCRSCSRAGGWTGCRSPGASSCSGASCGRGMWWQAHPYSLSAIPARRPPADHGQGRSATTAHALAGPPRPGPGSRSRVPTAPSPRTAAMPTGSCSSAPASARTPILALLQDLPGGRRRRGAAARARRREDLVLREEIAAEIARRRGRVHRARRSPRARPARRGRAPAARP